MITSQVNLEELQQGYPAIPEEFDTPEIAAKIILIKKRMGTKSFHFSTYKKDWIESQSGDLRTVNERLLLLYELIYHNSDYRLLIPIFEQLQGLGFKIDGGCNNNLLLKELLKFAYYVNSTNDTIKYLLGRSIMADDPGFRINLNANCFFLESIENNRPDLYEYTIELIEKHLKLLKPKRIKYRTMGDEKLYWEFYDQIKKAIDNSNIEFINLIVKNAKKFEAHRLIIKNNDKTESYRKELLNKDTTLYAVSQNQQDIAILLVAQNIPPLDQMSYMWQRQYSNDVSNEINRQRHMQLDTSKQKGQINMCRFISRLFRINQDKSNDKNHINIMPKFTV